MIATGFFTAIQLGILFVVTLVLGFVLGRHSTGAMILSGVLLLGLDHLASLVGFLPDHMTRWTVYMLVFPLIALPLQWLSGSKKRNTPNNLVEDIATNAANPNQ